MTQKEQQDKLWALLSDEEKQELRAQYNSYSEEPDDVAKGIMIAYETIFGKHNLDHDISYEEVANVLFKEHGALQPTDYGRLEYDPNPNPLYDLNFVNEEHYEKLIAINKLLNVAKYLNRDWRPDWTDHTEKKWSFALVENAILIDAHITGRSAPACFRSKSIAKKARKILGDDVIRTALSTDY